MKVTPIRSQDTYQSHLARAAVLMLRSDQGSRDELEVLQAVIAQWERKQIDLTPPSPVEAIRFRMLAQDLKPRDLEPYIGSRARVSEILSGTRPLSIDMIRALHSHLGIPAESLIASAPPHRQTRRTQPSKLALDKLRSFGLMRPREAFDSFIARAMGPNCSPALLRKTRTDRTNVKTDLAALDAWCAAVMLRAEAVSITPRKSVRETLARELAVLSTKPDGPARVAPTLAKHGIVYVALEHLPGTYLDGAALRRRSDGAPVIALTLRHDRVDSFWFTLLHEFCHIARHLDADTPFILDDLEVSTSDDIEEEADRFAQDNLIPPDVWQEHVSPDLSSEDVIQIARQAQVHPAIVAGRWQREHGDYRRFSKMLGRGDVRKLHQA